MTDQRRTQITHSPLAAALCALLAAAVYSNTFNSSFQFDDYLYVIDYCRTHTLSDFWPPHGTRYFTYLTFVLNFMAGGLDTTGYHVVNLLIHATNGFLVYLISMSLAASTRLADKGLPAFGIALLAALLFISHPVQTEAVAYVTQRFASLATLLYLLAMAMYLKYRLSGASLARALFYAMALLATYMAQVTKEISYTLPFMMLVMEFAFFTGPTLPRLARLAPFLLAMTVIPWILFGPGSGSAVGGEIMDLQLKDLREISRHDYLVTQFRVLVTYLRLMVLPIGQTIEYDYPMYRSLFTPGVLASFVFISTLFFGAIYLFLRFLKGASPFLALISAGVFWFFTAISVESSIVPIKDLIFEHRMYLPMAGGAIAASAVIFLASFAIAPTMGERRRLVILALLFVLPLSIAAYARNGVWENEMTLYEDAVQKSPGKERARYNLAWAYHKNGQLDRAIEQYYEDLKIDPEREKAHYNLALIFRDRRENGKAERHFLEAIRIKPSNPVARYNLAMLYHSSGQLGKAIASYEKAVEIAPGYEDARYNLAMALMETGDNEAAVAHLGEVLTANPGSVDALYNIGRAYARTGDKRRAALALSEALRVRPDFAEARAALAEIGGKR